MTGVAHPAVLPVDAIVERLNDPTVAASLTTLLDNAELLSTLVLGLSGMLERGDSIMNTVVDGIDEIRQVAASADRTRLPSLAELGDLAGEVGAAAPLLRRLLDSPAARPETIDFLGRLSSAAVIGAARANADRTPVGGLFGIRKVLKDDDVQAALRLMVEVARALGQQVRAEAQPS
jgi:tetrahydromethanopterin S-methyltransferase subunit C